VITDILIVKKVYQDAIDKVLRDSAYSSAVMASHAKHIKMYEGDALGSTVDSKDKKLDKLQHVEESMQLTEQEIENMSFKDFLKKIQEMGQNMGGQMEKGVIETLNKSIEESGNVIEGHKGISEEMILEMTEKLLIQFKNDNRAEPVMPTLYTGPGAAEEVKKLIKENTPEKEEAFKKRLDPILDKKYEEYMKDINMRKLTD